MDRNDDKVQGIWYGLVNDLQLAFTDAQFLHLNISVSNGDTIRSNTLTVDLAGAHAVLLSDHDVHCNEN